MRDSLLRERLLVLAPTGAACFSRPRWLRSPWALLAREPLVELDWLDANRLGGRLLELVKAANVGDAGMQVLVSDRLCRFFIVTPPLNSAGLGDLEAAARARHTGLFGLTTGWQIRADWDSMRPFLASSLPIAIISALDMLQSVAGVTCYRVQPHYVESVNHWNKQIGEGEWFGLLEGTHLTLGVVHDSSLVALRATWLVPEVLGSAEELSRFIAQEALRMGEQVPTLLKLAGDVPAAWVGRAPARSGCVRLTRLNGNLFAMAEGRA